jgi:hypothetical protein
LLLVRVALRSTAATRLSSRRRLSLFFFFLKHVAMVHDLLSLTLGDVEGHHLRTGASEDQWMVSLGCDE